MDTALLADRQAKARHWFEDLQMQLISAIETIERVASGPFADEAKEPGRFELTQWSRTNHDGAPGGGGRMAMIGMVHNHHIPVLGVGPGHPQRQVVGFRPCNTVSRRMS